MQTSTVAATTAVPRMTASTAPVSLRDLAKNALLDADGNVAEATQAMTDALVSNPETLRVSLREIVSEAAASFVGAAHRAKRAAVVLTVRSPEAGRRAAMAFAQGVGMDLFDFPLADGTRLRDATGSQVADMASRYAKTRDDAAKKSAWLSAIADRVPPNARVSDVLTLVQVTKLFEEA